MNYYKIVALCIFVMLFSMSCSSGSYGEKKAKEVIKMIEHGMPGPELQRRINEDGETLVGQDLLDYYETLEEYGLF